MFYFYKFFSLLLICLFPICIHRSKNTLYSLIGQLRSSVLVHNSLVVHCSRTRIPPIVCYAHIAKQIEKAQKKIENNNFGIRRNLLDYDQVNNDQREVIYAERRRVLNGESMRDVVYKMIKDVVADDVNMVAGEQPLKELNLVELNESLRRKIPLEPITLTDEEKEKNDKEALISRLQDEAMKVYHKKEKDFNEFAKVNVPEEGVELGEEDAAIFNDGIREVERVILLKVIDSKWMNHIDDMDQLRESIGLQSYAQKDPVVQYKFLGYEMFEEMT